jgi:serine/threonine protein kinase
MADDSLRTHVAAKIDPICHEFETAWAIGERPKIERFIERAGLTEREVLLRELLLVDIEKRRQLGEHATPGQYIARLPAHDGVIRRVFADRLSAATNSTELNSSVLESKSTSNSDDPSNELAAKREARSTQTLMPSGEKDSTRSDGNPVSSARTRFDTRLDGRYVIECELGRGGMGVVYRARDLERDRVVAIKMILGRESDIAELARCEIARFRLEAEAIACLRHPNVIKIHAVKVHDGCPYLVLEYARQGSLANRLTGAPLSPTYAAEVAKAVAEALHHCHRRGIVHRDLKPANILLMDDGRPAISDFGLVKRTSSTIDFGSTIMIPSLDSIVEQYRRRGSPFIRDGSFDEFLSSRAASVVQQFADEIITHTHSPQLGPDAVEGFTRTGMIVGTPHYMAPEQASGNTNGIGPKADLYSLGVVLYEMLAGCRPHEGKKLPHLLTNIISRPPHPMAKHVPSAIANICFHCLEKEPSRRYEDAGRLALDLKRFLTSTCVAGASSTSPPVATKPVATRMPEKTELSAQSANRCDKTKTWWQIWK